MAWLVRGAAAGVARADLGIGGTVDPGRDGVDEDDPGATLGLWDWPAPAAPGAPDPIPPGGLALGFTLPTVMPAGVTPQLTLTEGAGNVGVWRGDEFVMGRKTPTSDPVTAAPAGANLSGLRVVGMAEGAFKIALKLAGAAAASVVTDTVAGTVKDIKADLQIIKTDGTPLSDADEERLGGFVALNNDDDNYNQITDNDIVNEDVAGVDYESDLIPLKFSGTPIDGVKYLLSYNSTNIRVWKKNPDPGGKQMRRIDLVNSNDTLIDLGGSYFIEGVKQSVSTKDLAITLRARFSDGTSKILDESKLTVYAIEGATDVPGFGRYDYKTVTPGVTGHWSLPGHGQYGTILTPADGNTQTVLWGEGGWTSEVIFSPSAGFEVRREVHVVKIEFDSVVGSVYYTNQISQNPGRSDKVDSAPVGVWAMKGSILVRKISAPVRNINGKEVGLGLRYIDMGFVQIGTFKVREGTYDGNLVQKEIRYSGNGQWYLDQVGTTGAGDPQSSGDGNRGLKPWYDQKGMLVKSKLVNGVAYWRGSNKPVSAASLPLLFETADTPSQQEYISIDRTSRITGGAVKLGFQTFFVVHSTRTANDADKVYAIRAHNDWEFSADGSYANGKWTRNQATSYNRGGALFVESKDGLQIPVNPSSVAMNDITNYLWSPERP